MSSQMGSMKSWNLLGFSFRILFGVWFVFVVTWPVNGLRPLRQRRSWGEEVSDVCVCVWCLCVMMILRFLLFVPLLISVMIVCFHQFSVPVGAV